MKHLRISFLTLCSIALLCSVGGCGSHGAAPTGATQVVAKVNGHELTISELNRALAETREANTSLAATQEVLDRLINEELMVQAANKAKLDRDPNVLLRIDAVQRELLARVYEERQVFPGAPIEESEVHKFYDTHPALFSSRRIYHGVAFDTDQPKLPDELLTVLPQAHSADAVRALLLRYNVKAEESEFVRGAEALPLDLLPRLSAANPGDIAVATSQAGRTQLLLLNSIDSSPVTYEHSSNAIAHFLSAQRKQAALRIYMQQLLATAKIEYVGDNGPTTPAHD